MYLQIRGDCVCNINLIMTLHSRGESVNCCQLEALLPFHKLVIHDPAFVNSNLLRAVTIANHSRD
jgi:hypothetical protein